MLLFTLVCLAGIAPGVATVWHLRRYYGWPLALLAGAGVTAVMPCLLISSLIVFPPLGFAVGLAAAAAALGAYDDGRVWIATAWAAASVIALACAGWSL